MPIAQQVHISKSVTSPREIRDILMAYIVLSLAFSFVFSGGFLFHRFSFGFLALLPIAMLAVALSFILHELMHKFVAMHYGAWAEFRTWPQGLLITIVSSAFGFLIGIPGATYIFSNSFTKRQNGIVSLAGPATNLVIFFIFAGIGLALGPGTSYLQTAVGVVTFISLWLGFFNMIPFPPLDGSKVIRWNLGLYAVTMVAIIVLLAGLFLGYPL
jgi:Zn-dependent protease